MKDKRKTKEVDDKSTLRAFVMPEIYPFLLEIYLKEGKTEDVLNEDIKAARAKYKELVSLTKQKVAKTVAQV